MHIPGKSSEVHDKHHLCESDLNLRHWDTVYRIDDVTGLSTEVRQESILTWSRGDPWRSYRQPLNTTSFTTYMNATQGIFGPLRVMTIAYTPKLPNNKCNIPFPSPNKGTRKMVETTMENKCAKLGLEGGIRTKRDARG